MPRISKNQLIKLQKKYKTDESIGELYGITRQAVHQLRVRYGLAPVADKHDDRNKDVVRQYESGIPGSRLARKYGLSLSQIYRIVHSARPISRHTTPGSRRPRGG